MGFFWRGGGSGGGGGGRSERVGRGEGGELGVGGAAWVGVEGCGTERRSQTLHPPPPLPHTIFPGFGGSKPPNPGI